MFTLIPDSFITVIHHLERAVVEIDLCGCTKLSSSWFVTSTCKRCCHFDILFKMDSSIGGK